MVSNHLTIYQMALRTFTPSGTLTAATDLLPHVSSLGADIVYLCPVFKAESDPDLTTWSERQIASGTNNPKNPYKMYDYFHVDEEYGTDGDLKEFVNEAHRLGLKVLFDLVYLHCGKGAVFVKDHPDFIIRNEDSSPLVGEQWPFARLNYQSAGLREYLFSNIEYFIRDFGVDGFRCDVGDKVPLDFWEDSFARARIIKPDLITLNEGKNPEYLSSGAFNWCYSSAWRKKIQGLFRGNIGVEDFRAYCLTERNIYGDNVKRCTRCIDNHDTASDVGLDRNEKIMTSRGVDAALAVIYTYDGIPFLWNGVEFCDDSENSMFSNRFYGKRSAMDWSRAFTEKGEKRLDLIRRLHDLHHGSPSITKGYAEWLENSCPDDVISYRKRFGEETLTVIVNAKNKPLSVSVNAEIDSKYVCLGSGGLIGNGKIDFEPYGYLITKK